MKLRLGFVSNSSSSSFICRTDKTEEEIILFLTKLLDLYNEATGTTLKYEDCFQQPRMGSKNDEKYLKDWEENIEAVGQVIIESAGDNSIPYELFDLINLAFNAERIHLG